MSALDTLADTQTSKVGKREKTEPAVPRRKSPNQRRYEDVRSREYLLPEEVDAMMKAINSHLAPRKVD
jgi:type 1 fimbriae regulatory protein FimB/type 1 fimbriae regulatory protein FimE